MRDRYTVFRLFFTLLAGLALTEVQAQQIQVSGTVVDQVGEPLPGVNILVKGTTNGTISDIDGSYSLEVLTNNEVLVFSYIGFVSQEIVVKNQEVIDIALQEDIENLDEIVVIGYGTIKKSDVTGAMSSLGEKSFNQGVVSNPLELIQGRATGVQITPSSGAPGSAATVKIRGTGSVRSSNNPLYVIDGVPIGGGNVSPAGTAAGDLGGTEAKNPLNFLNPDDIESIDILKDASATAIYGSRGANGVILITTKKGESGEASISYSGYTSVSQIRKKMDILSAEDWRKSRVQLASETGNIGYLEYDFNNNTDWQDEIFRTAISQNHGIAISGGSDKGNYRASIGYMDLEGIVETSSMKRISARINVNQTLIQDRLNVGLNLTASNIKDRNAPIGDGGGFGGDVISNALTANPTWPITGSDGKYFQFSPTERNPVAMLNLIDDRTQTDRILGNVTADLKLAEGLNFNVNLGVDRTLSTRNINFSKDLTFMPNGYAEIRYNESSSYLMENFLKYNKSIGDHNLSAMAGYSYQHFETTWHSLVGQGYPTTEILPTGNIGGTTGEIEDQIYSGGPISELQSLFGRVNYSYQDKYLLTASVRMDGSSRFGSNNRYGLFPSGAIGWVLSKENFLQNNETVTNLKLRMGYGQTGNQEFTDYLPFPIVAKDPAGGIQTVQIAAPNIQWETTSQINIGVDFGLWSDRVTGTLDYFHRSTTDLLFDVPLPAPGITERGWTNLSGSLVNKGVEASATINWLKDSKWDWSSTVNFTMIDNVINDFNVTGIMTGQLNGPGLTAIYTQVIENNRSSQSFYLREFIGYDEEGVSMYANDGELAYVGSPYPDFQVSLNNRVSYDAFDLSIFIDAQKGNMVYNNTANAFFNKSALAQAKNITYEELNAPRSLSDGALPSTKYLEDASFIRLSTVTFGWNIPVKNISWMNNPRLYITGQNLLVLTKYTGFDPEVNTNKAVEGVPSAGIDYTSFPRPRTILLGFNLNF